MKNKNTEVSDNQAVSKLSAEFDLLYSFAGEVKRNKIQRRPMAKMPFSRLSDGRTFPVVVTQIEPQDWKKS